MTIQLLYINKSLPTGLRRIACFFILDTNY